MRELSDEKRYAKNREIGIVTIKDTRFIFKNNNPDSTSSCNLAGNPHRSNFGSSDRVCTIVIPDENLAKKLLGYGVNVKATENIRDEPDFKKEYFMQIKAGYKERADDIRNPVIRTYSNGGKPTVLDRDELVDIDEGRTGKIKVQLNPSTRKDGGVTMYIQFMDVEMLSVSNPFDDDYPKDVAPSEDDDYYQEELPFM